MGLITLGLFAVNDLGLNGAVLQMVNHGLISAVALPARRRDRAARRDRRAGRARRDGARPAGARDRADDDRRDRARRARLDRLRGRVRDPGRRLPDRLGLRGRRRRGDRARGDVHAAADLGGAAPAPGAAVTDAALDLRPAELGIVVPLVAFLLVLSAWPAAITERSFAGSQAVVDREAGAAVIARDAEHAADRLVRALAGARAARGGRRQPALRGARPARRPAPSPRSSARSASRARSSPAALLFATAPTATA